MLIRWVQNVLGQRAGQTATSANNTPRAPQTPITTQEIAHEAIKHGAARLAQISKPGPARRRVSKAKVAKDVRTHLSSLFQEDQLIDEVTERIVAAAEVDPYYRELFGKDEA